MIYNIPEELHPYLEYIPEDMLPEIITEALRAYIFAELVVENKEQTSFDLSQLLAMLQSQTKGNNEVVEKISKAVTAPESQAKVVCATVEDDDIPDELRDLVDDFALSAFK